MLAEQVNQRAAPQQLVRPDRAGHATRRPAPSPPPRKSSSDNPNGLGWDVRSVLVLIPVIAGAAHSAGTAAALPESDTGTDCVLPGTVTLCGCRAPRYWRSPRCSSTPRSCCGSLRSSPSPSLRRWKALTNAERQVFQLVSASLSNQEIGERLFVSRRTVETHVSDTLSKPGFTTRRELIAAVRDGRHQESVVAAEVPDPRSGKR